ncbi:ABC transporter permease [Myceligenerans crystallogenes]|uniref:ABC transporter permease subunit n=1 Tax=Myceligenerans crystallogenes TaxID=316335 RepID=A0ABN2NRB2_9MICO
MSASAASARPAAGAVTDGPATAGAGPDVAEAERPSWAPAGLAGRTRAPLWRVLRAEVAWVFRRPRTLAVLGLLTAIPVITGVALNIALGPQAAGPDGPGYTGSPGPALLTSMATSAFALPLGSLMTLLMMLLPLTVAMAAGDALAGEQSHGALRGWLLAPVSRGRLLLVKSVGVFAVGLVAASLVVLSGFLTGLALSGTDGLVSMSGDQLTFGDVLWRLALAVGWAALYLMAVGAVALAISASTEHPMVVVVSVLAGLIVSGVLMQIDALEPMHPYLLPTAVFGLTDLIRDPLAFGGMGEGLVRAGSYLVIGMSLAYARITTKDG